MRLLSLFSGIGGLDRGLHEAGFTSIAAVEKDPNARATLKKWHDGSGIGIPIFEDTSDLDPAELMERFDLRPGELELLAGGPPCQSFSLIGNRGSLEDARGLLLFEMVRFAEALRPEVILTEQVIGLRSAPGPEGKRGGALALFVTELEDLGYRVDYRVLRAAAYGVPQLRDRLFIVASHEPFAFPEPTHRAPSKKPVSGDLFRTELLPYRTLGDVISDLPAPRPVGEPEVFPNHADVTPSRDRERIAKVPEGECLARQTHLPISLRGRLNPRKDTTKFRRLRMDSPTLTLRGGEAFYHPTADRYLTPREYLRIHGFPDDHILLGPIRGRSGNVRDLDQHRLVANAVPPPLAKALGEAIAAQFATVGQES